MKLFRNSALIRVCINYIYYISKWMTSNLFDSFQKDTHHRLVFYMVKPFIKIRRFNNKKKWLTFRGEVLIWRKCTYLFTVSFPAVTCLQRWLSALPMCHVHASPAHSLAGLLLVFNESSKAFIGVHLFLNNCRHLLFKRYCLNSCPQEESMLPPFHQVHSSKINLPLKKYIIVLLLPPVS